MLPVADRDDLPQVAKRTGQSFGSKNELAC